MDPFENNHNVYGQQTRNPNDPNYSIGNVFPDFNSQWMSQPEEGIKSKIGKDIEKGTDIAKKASNFYLYGIGLIALLILLPPFWRFVYELSSWAFDHVGNMFP